MASEPHRKAYAIGRAELHSAWERVRAKGGTGGVDGETIASFRAKLDSNLYKLWNRMSSGSYHPKAVRRVEIPKEDGKKRPLGIPTIGDRVAQEVVRARLEPVVERFFHRDSHGYRAGKEATVAVGKCRERCWRYDWVVDVDIEKFFDTIDHDLMMKAVKHHCSEPWIVLYVERWLKSPVQHADGRCEERVRGTPQGGVISPLLANLYLHYAFDAWMERTFPGVVFERYADDIVIHCSTREQSEEVQQALVERLRECGLTLHPEKTKVVYCKDDNRRGRYPTKKFTFLGFTFQPRSAQNRTTKRTFTRFLPAAGTKAGKQFRARLKESGIFRARHRSLGLLAGKLNRRVRGWYGYFSAYYRSALYRMNDWLDAVIARWISATYACSWKVAWRKLATAARSTPSLFAHWSFRLPGRAV